MVDIYSHAGHDGTETAVEIIDQDVTIISIDIENLAGENYLASVVNGTA